MASEKVTGIPKHSFSQVFRQLFGRPNKPQKSVLGALTIPATKRQHPPGEYLYFRRVPVFKGSEYKCHLALDMTALRKYQPDELTAATVRDCLVLIKKGYTKRRPLLLGDRLHYRYSTIAVHHMPTLRRLSPGSLLPGRLHSPSKSNPEADIDVVRPIVIQKLFAKGTAYDAVVSLAHSKKPIRERTVAALALCKKMEKLVATGHKAGVIFGDLKLPNLAVTETEELVVCDLGCLQGAGPTANDLVFLQQSLMHSKDMLSDRVFEYLYVGTGGHLLRQDSVAFWRSTDHYALASMQFTTLCSTVFGKPIIDLYTDLVSLSEGRISVENYLQRRRHKVQIGIQRLQNRIVNLANKQEIDTRQHQLLQAQLTKITGVLLPPGFR